MPDALDEVCNISLFSNEKIIMTPQTNKAARP
jgi:hypothetical protein